MKLATSAPPSPARPQPRPSVSVKTRALLHAAALSCTAAIGKLRTACLTHLRARVAEPLAPPTDWARPVNFACRCPRCSELARFLADSERRTWAFKAAEADRSQVEGTIKQAGCDLDVTTDRRGRPHSLVCTKNRASYERRAKQRKKDLENLERLSKWPAAPWHRPLVSATDVQRLLLGLRGSSSVASRKLGQREADRSQPCGNRGPGWPPPTAFAPMQRRWKGL